MKFNKLFLLSFLAICALGESSILCNKYPDSSDYDNYWSNRAGTAAYPGAGLGNYTYEGYWSGGVGPAGYNLNTGTGSYWGTSADDGYNLNTASGYWSLGADIESDFDDLLADL